MEVYSHVTAGQQRDAADLLELAVAGSGQSVTPSVTGPANGVASSRPEGPEVARSRGKVGSGGPDPPAY
jgi:hypothetical protein